VKVKELDVTDAESVAALARRLDGQTIDLLINNAGVTSSTSQLADIDLEDFQHILQVNVLGPVRVTQALSKNLRAGSGKTIVCITSALGSLTYNTGGGFYGYRESKAALDMFVRNIAAELASAGFICIAMSPGWVKTDMGGPDAQLTPEQSITGMRKVIDGLKPADNGNSWNYDGKNVAW
jgi:NAD(P)-dependent dehydrogenase (short-subunit alcohol dehydrogenase family)